MSQTAATVADRYLAAGEALARQREREPEEARRLRRDALATFAALGLPTARDEDWRRSDVRAFVDEAFPPAPGGPALGHLTTAPFDIAGAHRLTFVDGWYAPELSDPGATPPGVRLGSLREALDRETDLVLAHLGRHADSTARALTALNTALWTDGAFVWLPDGAAVSAPVHILHLASGTEKHAGAFSRHLVVAGAGTRLAVVEEFAGGAASRRLTCVVTELAVAEGAVVDHHRLQMEDGARAHYGALWLALGPSARVSSHVLSLGSASARQEIVADLLGTGVDCLLNGLYIAGGRQRADTRVLVRHLAPEGVSRQLYKGIVDGNARAVFHGRIYVHPGARDTDAAQSNKNLLLSRDGNVSSLPQLEILADDVRCTHGSTVGQLDDDALFYMQARGIDRPSARAILTHAFAAEVAGRVTVGAVRRRLERSLAARLGTAGELADDMFAALDGVPGEAEP